MKLLKALLNSLLCGLFFCGLLALLFADLNINVKLSPAYLARLSLVLFLTYGLIAAFLCLVVFVLYTFLSTKKNIAMLSPTYLALGFSFLSLVFLLIFRGNVGYFRSFFGPESLAALNRQMYALLGLAALGPLACFGYYRFKRRAWFFVAYFVLAPALLVILFSVSPHPPLPRRPDRPMGLETAVSAKKVTIIGLQGLTFDVLLPLISEGKLPNFSLIVEQGCWGRLSSFTPSDPFILNASFNTGKLPARHRQISPLSYGVGQFKPELEVIPRYLFFKQLTRTGLLRLSPNSPAFRPKDIWQIFDECRMTQVRRDTPDQAEVGKDRAKAETLFSLLYKDLLDDSSPAFGFARDAFFKDSAYEAEAFQARTASSPQVFFVSLSGLTVVEKFFYQYAFPEIFGTIDPESLSKYGSVIERYYQFYDQIIGKYLAGLKEDELFVVFSAHGIEPLPLWKRVVEWAAGNPEISAFHEQAPQGAVFIYGQAVNRQRNLEGIRLVDMAPTILYYLGLPVGKDMDGIVRSSVYVREFTSENPIFSISSYEDYVLQPVGED